MRPVEHLKRWTTRGMATDQGKTANVTALAVMWELTGKPIPETGTTIFRPPYSGVSRAWRTAPRATGKMIFPSYETIKASFFYYLNSHRLRMTSSRRA